MLEVSDLRIRIGRTELVRGLSFKLAAGETLGIIGESGSGKTLGALALMGLLPAGAVASGSIRLGGQELLGMDEKAWCATRGKRPPRQRSPRPPASHPRRRLQAPCRPNSRRAG